MGATAWIDWELESYPKPEDLLVVPFFALFFPSVRLFLDRCVFEKLARRMIFGKGHVTLDVEAGPGDQVWPDQKIKLKLKAFYMYAAGFYTYSIIALIFWETRRADFLVSMVHHIATVILIILSYIFRFARVGSVILALHDGSDVFLEVGKMSKYSGFEKIASVSFALFVLSWTVLRLIYYPFRILRSTSYEVLLTLDMEKHMVNGSIYYYLFNTLLFCLLVVHIYWWKLMFVMLLEQIRARGQIGDDARSDSESEAEHED
ncbi:hypothetical protein F2P56_013015 [Juglans regia]|uniref:TLC domain-containing protein n=2 Tax=Juglans regia TaxID=51240 RepID=A0A833XNS9_JUGRE|nr:ASC1-like protein isoform X2 [Juglans regia]KAF5468904.1 hypothetical protein F2P56_013015 [Juglans regia]